MVLPASQSQPVATPLTELPVVVEHELLSLIAGGGSRTPPATEAPEGAGRPDAAGYRRFLDALGVALYTTDAAGRITFFNAAAVDLWGRRPALGEEWCGSLELHWPDETPMRHDECPMAIALKEQRPVRGGEAILVRPDGSKLRFLPYPTPLFADDGSLQGAVNILVDVTDRHLAQEDALAASRALAASNAVKDEFLGLVSHELRTPVTSIYGNARLLEQRGAQLDEAVKASMLSDMAEDADRLHSIIENLLHLTRLGSGSALDLEPQVIDRVVDRAVRSFRARNRTRQVELVTSEPSAVVDGEETYLALLLENLLTNAVKYSAPPAPIEIEVGTEGDEVFVVVRDRGIGFGDSPPRRSSSRSIAPPKRRPPPTAWASAWPSASGSWPRSMGGSGPTRARVAGRRSVSRCRSSDRRSSWARRGSAGPRPARGGSGLERRERIPVGARRRKQVDDRRAVRAGRDLVGDQRRDPPRPARAELATLVTEREPDRAGDHHAELLGLVLVPRDSGVRGQLHEGQGDPIALDAAGDDGVAPDLDDRPGFDVDQVAHDASSGFMTETDRFRWDDARIRKRSGDRGGREGRSPCCSSSNSLASSRPNVSERWKKRSAATA